MFTAEGAGLLYIETTKVVLDERVILVHNYAMQEGLCRDLCFRRREGPGEAEEGALIFFTLGVYLRYSVSYVY